MAEKYQLCGMTLSQLEDLMAQLGQGKYRAKQIQQWINLGKSVDEMSNLSKALRAQLAEVATAIPVRIEASFLSKLDDTEKLAFELDDGNIIEGVIMRYHHGDTLCLSTQVGCRMGCAFCASTLDGRVRNLTPGEMLGQVLIANAHVKAQDENRRIHNLVLMGSGEPLDNYDNTVQFLRLVNSADGLNISLRNISLSTCGLVPRMEDFIREGLPVTLCISLHAPNDKIRQQIMPIASAYPIKKVIRACKDYVEATGRRVIIEYALISGVNDSFACADELAVLLKGLNCHVNLIPLNDVKERDLYAPTHQEVQAFQTRLARNRVSATVRRQMGADIDGACGQLRRRIIAEKHEG